MCVNKARQKLWHKLPIIKMVTMSSHHSNSALYRCSSRKPVYTVSLPSYCLLLLSLYPSRCSLRCWMAPMILPPGFRFHPTDEELVAYYLDRKISGRKIELEIIPKIDLYKCEPWDLPGIYDFIYFCVFIWKNLW